MKGTIKSVLLDKHYGFIRGTNGTEYFFHKSENKEVWPKLKSGDSVEFEIAESNRGPRAADVRII